MTWPTSRSELIAFIEQSPTNVSAVMVALLRLYPNETLRDAFDFDPVASWMERKELSRVDVAREFYRAKLKLIEAGQISDNPAQQKETALRGLIRDKIMKAGRSESYAYAKAREKQVESPFVAKIMAEVRGGEWTDYYCRASKRGPSPDYEKGVLKYRPEDACFTAYMESGEVPESLEAVAKMMAQRDDEHFGDIYRDESQFLDIARKRGADANQASQLWTYYAEWAVKMVAGVTIETIKEKRRLIEIADMDFG